MAAPGVAVPGSVVAIGSQASPAGPQGIQGPAIVNAFVTKSAAYTLTSADSGKYFICSGGSWTLTLPAPAAGLVFQVRNDMGISGTIGTITLSPTGGTIDGLASIALLPGQECTVITDGTNWRTFGKQRMVILGTQDTIAASNNIVVLLPAGYRLFILDFTNLIGSAEAALTGVFSADGGSTYLTTNYYYEYLFNNAATTAAAGQLVAGASMSMGSMSTALGAQTQLKIYPGSSTSRPSWQLQNAYYSTAGSLITEFIMGGFLASNQLVNALKYSAASGTINNSFLTVKGVV
jgi:hypothetical protein